MTFIFHLYIPLSVCSSGIWKSNIYMWKLFSQNYWKNKKKQLCGIILMNKHRYIQKQRKQQNCRIKSGKLKLGLLTVRVTEILSCKEKENLAFNQSFQQSITNTLIFQGNWSVRGSWLNLEIFSRKYQTYFHVALEHSS